MKMDEYEKYLGELFDFNYILFNKYNDFLNYITIIAITILYGLIYNNNYISLINKLDNNLQGGVFSEISILIIKLENNLEIKLIHSGGELIKNNINNQQGGGLFGNLKKIIIIKGEY